MVGSGSQAAAAAARQAAAAAAAEDAAGRVGLKLLLLLPVKQQQQPQMLRVGSALKLLRLLLPPVKLQQQPQRLLRVGNAKGTTKSRRFRRLHDPPSGAPRVNRREALVSPSRQESHRVTSYCRRLGFRVHIRGQRWSR